MPLNFLWLIGMAIGHMYPWVAETWNPVGGVCPHDCIYCYVKALKKRNKHIQDKYSGSIRLIEKELKNLGRGKIIFVCSCIDLFAVGVTDEIIYRVLEHCNKYQDFSIFLINYRLK